VDDDAVADLETGIEVAAVARDAEELNAVLEARARMEAGGYGLCVDCGAPIAFERLLARPDAPRCIRCETERERLRARPSLPAL
jgi:RNA polymerase-binding transcription factor DksA